VIAAATGADGLILNSGYVTRKVLEALAPRLKVVSRRGVGYERVDTDAATTPASRSCAAASSAGDR